MTTNIESAAEVLRDDKHYKMGPHGEQFPTSEAASSLADAGLLVPDEDERLPSWVYDHPDVCTNPHRMGGQPCIRGTRVPVGMIFNLMDGPDGCTDEEIIEFYPSVPTGAISRLRTAREEHDA